MMEHALFLYLGLEDSNYSLKNEAFEHHEKWKDFMYRNFYNRGIEFGIDQVFLDDEELDKVGNLNIEETNELIGLTEKFVKKIVNILESGEWIGWIFPSLAKHMLKETIYFSRKVNGPVYSPEEEIIFINEHHGEEMGATAQLIDPSQQKAIDLVRSYALKEMHSLQAGKSLTGYPKPEQIHKRWTKKDDDILKGLDITEQATLLHLSIIYSDEITKLTKETCDKIDKKEFQGIIHPVLAHHAYREFVRFTVTLKLL